MNGLADEIHRGRVLVVDDELNALRVLTAILRDAGFLVFEALNVDRAVSIIDSEEIDTVITDLKMPERDGMYLFEYICEHHAEIPTIFLTAFGSVDSAVQAMTRGAFYYFIKPPHYSDLKNILSKAIEQRRLKREIHELKRKLSEGQGAYRILGNAPCIQHVLQVIESVRDSASSVLVTGDTGTGKELVARALHYGGLRKGRPFIAMNCAAVPGELVESELFGYEKGSFTGAVSPRTGKFEEAAGGTIFLDEIGELDISLQAKLLRVLQEKEVVRIGSSRKIPVDFRLVCSTNRNLNEEVKKGNFREDLFYRINVVHIKVPSLNERGEDIPLLVAEFVKEFCAREKKMLGISHEFLRLLQNRNWAGNIRELRNTVERAVLLCRGDKLTVKDLPDDQPGLGRRGRARQISRPLKDAVREREEEAIRDALRECDGNKTVVARSLGISRKALYKRLRELNISA